MSGSLCFTINNYRFLEEKHLSKFYNFDVSYNGNDANLTVRAKSLEVALQVIEAYGRSFKICEINPGDYDEFLKQNVDKVFRFSIVKRREHLPIQGGSLFSRVLDMKEEIVNAFSGKKKKEIKVLFFEISIDNPLGPGTKKVGSHAIRITDKERDYLIFKRKADELRAQGVI